LQIIKNYNIDIFRFSVLQSIVSLPNIVTCVLAGLLIDYIGLPASALLFSALSLMGTAIFAASAHLKDFNLALTGRAIFGIGSECQYIWYNCLSTIWFFYAEGSTASATG
jgi:MFS family permease